MVNLIAEHWLSGQVNPFWSGTLSETTYQYCLTINSHTLNFSNIRRECSPESLKN